MNPSQNSNMNADCTTFVPGKWYAVLRARNADFSVIFMLQFTRQNNWHIEWAIVERNHFISTVKQVNIDWCFEKRGLSIDCSFISF